MHCKGRFGASRNTGEIIAVANDAFEEGVIINELKTLNEADSSEADESKCELPVMAKHFLVFIATTWTAECKIQFLVARYGLAALNANFLIREIRKIIMSLALYGFVVDTITGDGASENRLTFKTLATITARDILSDHFTADELKGLPLDFKIGFNHPHPMLEVIIVIGGEMPHWVKKFRNAFDNKSRDLKFRGKAMALVMIYEIWLASGDQRMNVTASLRRYIFTHDHFNLNAYLKMRVFLAVQIPSATCIRMIKDHCEDTSNDAVIADYQPMIDLFTKVDRLVDIWNGTNHKKGKVRNVELINKPKHRHITELFDVLRLFEEWKKEGKGKFTKNFITKQTYEDLVWMVFGIAAVACLNLDEDGSKTMHQGRGGTDVNENFFSRMRYINSNPTMQQAREAASQVTSGSGMHIRAFQSNNRGNSGTAEGGETAEDLLAPLN